MSINHLPSPSGRAKKYNQEYLISKSTTRDLLGTPYNDDMDTICSLAVDDTIVQVGVAVTFLYASDQSVTELATTNSTSTTH